MASLQVARASIVGAMWLLLSACAKGDAISLNGRAVAPRPPETTCCIDAQRRQRPRYLSDTDERYCLIEELQETYGPQPRPPLSLLEAIATKAPGTEQGLSQQFRDQLTRLAQSQGVTRYSVPEQRWLLDNAVKRVQTAVSATLKGDSPQLAFDTAAIPTEHAYRFSPDCANGTIIVFDVKTLMLHSALGTSMGQVVSPDDADIWLDRPDVLRGLLQNQPETTQRMGYYVADLVTQYHLRSAPPLPLDPQRLVLGEIFTDSANLFIVAHEFCHTYGVAASESLWTKELTVDMCAQQLLQKTALFEATTSNNPTGIHLLGPGLYYSAATILEQAKLLAATSPTSPPNHDRTLVMDCMKKAFTGEGSCQLEGHPPAWIRRTFLALGEQPPDATGEDHLKSHTYFLADEIWKAIAPHVRERINAARADRQ